jgi:hypothetical protein
MLRKCDALALLLTATTLGAAPAAKPKTPTALLENPDTLPPAEYVVDWYAPPTDWFPAKDIRDYTLNTRVPDLFWLKYDGAYTLALRIRPIAKEMIDSEIAVKLISNANAATFAPAAEKDAKNRTVGVFHLDVPADDLVELSFKAKVSARNAGANFIVRSGLGTIRTARNEDRATSCQDGFKAYKVTFPARKGAVLRDVSIELEPATAADFQQEVVIFDFVFKRSAPKARFADIPSRRWVRQDAFAADRPLTPADSIPDIYAFVNTEANAVDSIPLAVQGWATRPQGKDDRDDGYTVETIRESVGGKECDGVRITLTQGSRCYLKFPTAFDGTTYNTMTFLARIEVPDGLDPRWLIGDDYPRLSCTDAAKINCDFDSFSFGVQSDSDDPIDYNRWGVNQATFANNWQRAARPPPGWKAVAFDIMNDTYTGNKGTFNARLTHWCFYYANGKIPEGKKIVVTIMNPKVSSGFLLAGGDRAKFKQFLAQRKEWKPDYSDSARFLDAPASGRLAAPLPLIRNGKAQGEFVVDYSGNNGIEKYKVIVDRALANANSFLTKKYGADAAVPVLTAPSGSANTKIFVGGSAYARVNRKQYDADMQAMAGKPGCAIRADGRSVYLYAANAGYAGDSRGLANGLYTFLENNTDVIVVDTDPNTRMSFPSDEPGPRFIFDAAPGGNLDIAWGDYRNVPPLHAWGVCAGVAGFNDFNRAATMNVWGNWMFGGFRGRSCNHWWGYGTGSDGTTGKENDTWGIGEDGKRMMPGCYTGHPCLINVLESAKADYVKVAFSPTQTTREWCYDAAQRPEGDNFAYNSYDALGLWTEDCQNVCMCEKCMAPIRLPDGTLLRRSKARYSQREGEFLCAQFFANACAMINQVNVYAKRNMQVESIAYLWMLPVPRFEISRNYRIRVCPYVRKDYFEPLYAPFNDMWWRAYHRWGQQNIHLAQYEYFLYVNCRPWADVCKLDLQAEVAEGLQEAIWEGTGDFTRMERWVVTRLLWEPDSDVMELRKYFLRRAFREAAPEMEKFWFTFYKLIYEKFALIQQLEFEDRQQMGALALRTQSANGAGTVADELTRYLDAAQQVVRNEASKELLQQFREGWDKYIEGARKR